MKYYYYLINDDLPVMSQIPMEFIVRRYDKVRALSFDDFQYFYALYFLKHHRI